MTEAELKRFAERTLEGRFPENDLAAAVLALFAERDEARRDHIALMNVSGALMDSGEVVPEDECLYGEAVRKIIARAEAAEAKLAEARSEHYAAENEIKDRWSAEVAAERTIRQAAEARLAEAERELAAERAHCAEHAKMEGAFSRRIDALERALSDAESVLRASGEMVAADRAALAWKEGP